jgi:hypothetical protein
MVFDLFLAPQAWPFSVALALVLAIAVIEGAAQMLGFPVFGWIDGGALGASDAADAWLGWLHVGKVPVLVLLVILLTSFAMIGYLVMAVAWSLLGVYPAAWLSAPLAFFGALPVVRGSGLVIARLIPRDETSAVSLDTLVGRVAVVVNGTARAGYPAQARVRNEAGQSFYVHVEPDDPAVHLESGASVLLVKQLSGARFTAIANPRPDLL